MGQETARKLRPRSTSTVNSWLLSLFHVLEITCLPTLLQSCKLQLEQTKEMAKIISVTTRNTHLEVKELNKNWTDQTHTSIAFQPRVQTFHPNYASDPFIPICEMNAAWCWAFPHHCEGLARAVQPHYWCCAQVIPQPCPALNGFHHSGLQASLCWASLHGLDRS